MDVQPQRDQRQHDAERHKDAHVHGDAPLVAGDVQVTRVDRRQRVHVTKPGDMGVEKLDRVARVERRVDVFVRGIRHRGWRLSG